MSTLYLVIALTYVALTFMQKFPDARLPAMNMHCTLKYSRRVYFKINCFGMSLFPSEQKIHPNNIYNSRINVNLHHIHVGVSLFVVSCIHCKEGREGALMTVQFKCVHKNRTCLHCLHWGNIFGGVSSFQG